MSPIDFHVDMNTQLFGSSVTLRHVVVAFTVAIGTHSLLLVPPCGWRPNPHFSIHLVQNYLPTHFIPLLLLPLPKDSWSTSRQSPHRSICEHPTWRSWYYPARMDQNLRCRCASGWTSRNRKAYFHEARGNAENPRGRLDWLPTCESGSLLSNKNTKYFCIHPAFLVERCPGHCDWLWSAYCHRKWTQTNAQSHESSVLLTQPCYP